MRELNITTREEGQRLDKILSKYLNKAPKSFVYKMLWEKKYQIKWKKQWEMKNYLKEIRSASILQKMISKFREEVGAGKQRL